MARAWISLSIHPGKSGIRGSDLLSLRVSFLHSCSQKAGATVSAFRRFDPYMTSDSDISIEDAWEYHCNEIWSIFYDNEPLLRSLFDESEDAVIEVAKETMKQMMVQYRTWNIEWFASINGAMRRLIEVNLTGNREQRDCTIDGIINLELDPIVKKELSS